MFPTVRLVALLAATPAMMVSAMPPATWCPAWFDSLAPRWMASAPDVPGVQFSIWAPRCGNLHCKGAWDNPDFQGSNNHPPLRVDTPNRLASVTKPFTALSVLKLVEEGIVDLHTSVFDYLPDWAVDSLEKRVGGEANRITPWMLLHHTSGIGDSSGARWNEYILPQAGRKISLRETLEWFADNAPAVGSPGQAFAYSDTGYIYLGLLIETVNEDNYTMAAAAREAAQMDRLGMTSTFWEVYEDHPAGVPPRPGQYKGPIDTAAANGAWFNYGGTGLVGSAEDLIKFARAFHRGCLLGKAGMELAYTTVPTGKLGYGDGYGCGWFRQDMFGYDVWAHLGGFGGWIVYVPELDLAMAGTTNQADRVLAGLDYIKEALQLVLAEGCI